MVMNGEEIRSYRQREAAGKSPRAPASRGRASIRWIDLPSLSARASWSGRHLGQVGAFQQAYQSIANLRGQLCRGCVFEDVSYSVEGELITDVPQRIVRAELPESTRLFRCGQIQKPGENLPITVMHGWHFRVLHRCGESLSPRMPPVIRAPALYARKRAGRRSSRRRRSDSRRAGNRYAC